MPSNTNGRVLVLNRLWQAVNTCSVERAMALLWTGHAQVVHEENGNFNTFSFNEWCDFSTLAGGYDSMRTISLHLRIPRIILLLFFDRLPRKEITLTRQNVFLRDKNTCQYCGRKFERSHLNIDHVIPRQKGGQTTWTNVVCSCVDCNCRKANRTPREAGMRLIHKPVKPKWHPFIEITFNHSMDNSWRHFLNLAYWHVELGQD